MNYPPTPREDLVETIHGVPVADPYRWLEDLDSERTRAWIAAQNELTAGWLAAVPERERIVARLTALWDHEKFGLPRRRAGRVFFSRNSGLQNQSVLYWAESLEAEPQVLLDPNALSADGTVALGPHSISEDGRLIAYSLTSGGSDWLEWRVREVDSGRDLPDRLEWSKFSGASWSHDSLGFYYSRYDAPAGGAELKGANYFQKLCYHRLGEPQAADRLVYERPDRKEWGFGGGVTEDGRYLVIHVWSGTARENGLFYLDLADPAARVVELLADFDASYGFIGNDGARFFLQTDLDAPRSRVVAVDLARPARTDWREIVPQSEDALLGAGLVADRLVLDYLHDAHSRVRIVELDGRPVRDVELPGLGSAVGFDGRRTDRDAFYAFTSFTSPGTIYRYDMDTGRSTVWRRPKIEFDPDGYESRQVFATSADGTRVPVFLCHRKGLARDGRNPVYLYSYGGFGLPLTPFFSVSNLVWMEMGGVLAVACLRGGGEYGNAWHDGGRLARKPNTFADLVAAAELLIGQGYTSPQKLAIGGGSNGGLTVAATMNLRPDLFGACIAEVGVLDMLRFHKFTIGWAWASDYGSPDDPEQFKWLLGYSPYHNLKPGARYPATLVLTGDHDDRVFPAHSFKYAAALQAAQGGEAPALIRVQTRAGHGHGKPTARIIEECADRWAFLLRALGEPSG